jgi:hypothetical protein
MKPFRQFHLRTSAAWIVAILTLGISITAFVACKGRDTQEANRWSWIVEGINNERYFVDRDSIEYVSKDIVRVSFKYSPTKGEFANSMRELSKEFGKDLKANIQEYTLSTWEFNCSKPEGRCLSLAHYKKDSKVASYEYPQQPWSELAHAASTKMLRDVVCAEASNVKR